LAESKFASAGEMKRGSGWLLVVGAPRCQDLVTYRRHQVWALHARGMAETIPNALTLLFGNHGWYAAKPFPGTTANVREALTAEHG